MSFAEMAFSGTWHSRHAEWRDDPARLASLLDHPQARVLPVWRGKPQMQFDNGAAQLAWVSPKSDVLAHAPRPFLYLGADNGVPLFAADLSDWEPDAMDRSALAMFHDVSLQRYPGTDPGMAFADLRVNLLTLSTTEAALAATARALFNWHHRHGFCASCGQPSTVDKAGWERLCNACGAHHYPRTDPVVIMLVTRGNSTLLGRSPAWPAGMFSTLAGFVEPGESIEAAVAREILEETGLQVNNVRYVASQPWPFPASLMIGCAAQTEEHEITLDDELEDARWFTREEVLAVWSGERTDLIMARKGAIAHYLLGLWLQDRI